MGMRSLSIPRCVATSLAAVLIASACSSAATTAPTTAPTTGPTAGPTATEVLATASPTAAQTPVPATEAALCMERRAYDILQAGEQVSWEPTKPPSQADRNYLADYLEGVAWPVSFEGQQIIPALIMTGIEVLREPRGAAAIFHAAGIGRVPACN